MSAPNLVALLWTHWQLSIGLDVQGACWALLYLLAARRVRQGWPALRTASFLLGIACALIALQSGLDAFDTRLLSAHMIQHLLLIELAPLLLVGGRPALLALQALPPSRRPALARGLRRLLPLTGAVPCLILYSAVVLGTHVPAVQDATVRTPLLHEAEHAGYLLAGLLLW
ncbi:MAG TPA: cytochrome c oxidase assembly protein, partial [Solirubrobacteraceae bacterium]|nr:cytochrome c oxidase assembly protein [Solirubrobacteraceae bacterium]